MRIPNPHKYPVAARVHKELWGELDRLGITPWNNTQEFLRMTGEAFEKVFRESRESAIQRLQAEETE
jgi:hypothetical protein